MVDDGALNIVVVGGGATGVESAGRARGALPRRVREELSGTCRRTRRGSILVEAGPTLFSMFKADIRAYTEKALAKRTVEVMVGEMP